MPETPSLTAVVATRDRPALLDDCLATLAAQELAGARLEVVVVDDGSSPPLAPRFPTRTSAVDWRIVRQRPSGLSVARNTGASVARAPLIAYLDDDTFVTPGWASAMLTAFSDGEVDGVAGRVVLDLEGNPAPKWLNDGLRRYLSECDLGPTSRVLRDGEFPVGANCAVRRSAFDRVGGFSPAFGRSGSSLRSNEEFHFFGRVCATGGTLAYEPEALVRHRVPAERLTTDFFVRRSYAQGQSDVRLAAEEAFDGKAGLTPGRELLRLLRVIPIMGQGLLIGHGTTSARAWIAYCRGRIDALRQRDS